jgi:mannose-6-phosphate isomerase
MLNVVTKRENYNLQSYTTGESAKRPWGSYKVVAAGKTDMGEEFCEKEITVEPGHILSLQSHRHRREQWTVKSGTLIVVLDDAQYTLSAGQSIHIPQGAIHCMANGGNEDCIVYELQMGLCSEDDIIRYVDAYGRADTDLDTRSRASADLFNRVKSDISRFPRS